MGGLPAKKGAERVALLHPYSQSELITVETEFDSSRSGAPVIICVLASKEVPTYVCDGSLALGNMMLAAHALGLGGIWIHRCREEFETDEFKALLSDLGVEGDYEGVGHLALGYAEKDGVAAPRREGRVFWVR